jgi:beta-N-acetylhexosaminidase
MSDFASVILALILAASLFGSFDTLAAGQVDVRGTITHLRRAEGESQSKVWGRILIEGVKEPDTQHDKASVAIRSETKLFIRRGKERQPAEFTALKEGQKVEAIFTGPVAESYPVQATAAEITIIED